MTRIRRILGAAALVVVLAGCDPWHYPGEFPDHGPVKTDPVEEPRPVILHT